MGALTRKAPQLPPRSHERSKRESCAPATSPRNAFPHGARGHSGQACSPWAPTRDRGHGPNADAPGLSSPAGTTATHCAPQGAPTPAFAGLGAPEPQLGGRGPRFQPKAGRRPGRKGKAGLGGVGTAAGGRPSPGRESPAPSFHLGSSFLLARCRGRRLTPGRRTENARPAQPPRCARSSGGSGEGRTRRLGQGERAAPPTWRGRAVPRGFGHRSKLRDRGTSLRRRREGELQMGAARGAYQSGGAGLPPAAEGGSGAVRPDFAREK